MTDILQKLKCYNPPKKGDVLKELMLGVTYAHISALGIHWTPVVIYSNYVIVIRENSEETQFAHDRLIVNYNRYFISQREITEQELLAATEWAVQYGYDR